MTRQELIQKRDEVTATLIAAGWDEDDARFASMTATAAKPSGLLSDQPTGATHPALVELAQMAQTVAPIVQPVFRSSPDSLYDADHDQ